MSEKNEENPTKIKEIINTVKVYFILFFEKGVIHGTNFLAFNFLHFIEKCFWIGLLVSSIYFFAIFSLESWNRFQSNSTVVTIEKDHYYWNSSLPALTICPMDRISKTKFNEYCIDNNIYDKDKEEFFEFILSLANSTYINFQDIKAYKSVERLEIRPEDYMKLIYDLSEDMTRREAELKVRCINNLEFILSMQVLTEFGICYTTNTYIGQNLTVKKLLFNEALEDDPFYRSEIVHAVKYGNLFDEHITYSFMGFEEGIITFIHSPHDVMNIAKTFVYADDAYEFKAYSMEIMASDEFRESTTVQQRGCRFTSESNLQHFDIYSKGLCIQECRLNLAFKHCGCIPHFYPNRISNPKPVCSYQTLMTCFPPKKEFFLEFRERKSGKNADCFCLPNCADTIIIIESSQLLRGTQSLLGSAGSLVAVKQYSTVRFVRRILFSFTDLLVSIGGTAGLLLGFSVLGAVEIIYIFTLRLIFYIKGRR